MTPVVLLQQARETAGQVQRCYWCGLTLPVHQTRCPEGRQLLLLAMNIVNQLFDLAEVPVAKRQEINDRCDRFVVEVLTASGLFKSAAGPQPGSGAAVTETQPSATTGHTARGSRP